MCHTVTPTLHTHCCLLVQIIGKKFGDERRGKVHRCGDILSTRAKSHHPINCSSLCHHQSSCHNSISYWELWSGLLVIGVFYSSVRDHHFPLRLPCEVGLETFQIVEKFSRISFRKTKPGKTRHYHSSTPSHTFYIITPWLPQWVVVVHAGHHRLNIW